MYPIKSSDLRKRCSIAKRKTTCFICGKHSLVVQRHHVYPLSDLSVHVTARQLKQCIEPPTVCLCPTCHSYVHKAMNNPELIYDFTDLSNSEQERVKEILVMQLDFLDQFSKWLDSRR